MAEPPDTRTESGPAPSPPGLSGDWPVPWKPVWGDRDGFGDRLANTATRSLLAVASRLPEAVLEPCIGAFARLARRIDRRHARAAREFLRQALGAQMPPAELERRVLETYRHLFRVIVEGRALSRLARGREVLERFELDICEDARRVLSEGQGSVLVTGHIGNWEASVAALPWLGFDPLYVVARPPRNRPMSVDLQRERERRGVRVLPRNGAIRDAVKVVEAGGCVGLLLDQRARTKPVIAPFFGRPARCDRSAGVLLRRLRVPVAIGACYRTGERLRYRLEIPEVLWPEELAETGAVELATRINGALERLILRAPEQYFWLHDRYKGASEQLPEPG